MQHTLYASAVGKFPGWEVLDARLLAGVIFSALPLRAALDIVDVLKGVSEEFLLVGAVRAPPCPVHLRAAFGHALRESIQRADRLAIVGEIINRPCDGYDSQGDYEPS